MLPTVTTVLGQQQAMNLLGIPAGPEDGVDGPKTQEARRSFQRVHGLPITGQTDGGFELALATALRTATIPPPPPTSVFSIYPFVQARNFTRAQRTSIDLIVIHTMEAPEKPATAENVAAWFAGANAPPASAHYCVDSDSIVQCVRDADIAWHAPGANHHGIGVEHAGYARQTPEEWDDAYSRAMLARSSELVARLCHTYDIPVTWLSSFALAVPGARGITGHLQCTDAFSGGKGHTDPGPHFPIEAYLAQVNAALSKLS